MCFNAKAQRRRGAKGEDIMMSQPELTFIAAANRIQTSVVEFAMKLNHGLHLAYCTNVHRGENWAETFASLQTHTLAVRQRVCPDTALRHRPAPEQSGGARIERRAPRCASFKNGWSKTIATFLRSTDFPSASFTAARVKEQVYPPDWTSPERLAYTNLLFDLLARACAAGDRRQREHVAGVVQGVHHHAGAGASHPRQSLAMRGAHRRGERSARAASCIWASNRSRWGGSKTARKRSGSSSKCAPNIRTIRGWTNIWA